MPMGMIGGSTAVPYCGERQPYGKDVHLANQIQMRQARAERRKIKRAWCAFVPESMPDRKAARRRKMRAP
jgi:hypothetical protein